MACIHFIRRAARSFSTSFTQKFFMGLPWDENGLQILGSASEKFVINEYFKEKALTDSGLIPRFVKIYTSFLEALAGYDNKALEDMCEKQFSTKICSVLEDLKKQNVKVMLILHHI